MKHQWLAGLALLASGIGVAQAGTNLSIAVGVPLGGVYYDNYYAPPPPPVYYRERVYYEPRYYVPAPRPVYYAPRVNVQYSRPDYRYYERRDYGRDYDRHDRRYDRRDRRDHGHHDRYD